MLLDDRTLVAHAYILLISYCCHVEHQVNHANYVEYVPIRMFNYVMAHMWLNNLGASYSELSLALSSAGGTLILM